MPYADAGFLQSTVGKPKNPPRPILFDLHLDALPPSYEILFMAELDSDHRVARVPFKELPASEALAFSHAFSEFQQLTEDDIDRHRRASTLIDRPKV